MSRGFVKEPAEVPTLAPPARSSPLRLAPARLARLRAACDAAADDALRAELAARVAAVVAVEPPADPAVVAFGASVDLEDGSTTARTFEIVDDDDGDPAAGRIGESSPLALALLGRRAGETVLWRRPAGERRVKLLAVRYEAP